MSCIALYASQKWSQEKFTSDEYPRYSRFNNIGNSLSGQKNRVALHQNLYEGEYTVFLPTTTTYKMGCRLLDDIIYRIRIHLKAGKEAPAIVKAVGVAKKIIYKL